MPGHLVSVKRTKGVQLPILMVLFQSNAASGDILCGEFLLD